MRRWERKVEKPPVSRGYDHHHGPSFSSSLLDSIYRSIDNDENRPEKPARGAPHQHSHSSRWAPPAAEKPAAVTRSKKQSSAVTGQRQFHSTTSSSSDCSSYGGFSSSETESVSVAAVRPKSNRLRPIRTEKPRSDTLPPRPPSPEMKKIKNLGSIRGKLRDLNKSESRSPSSPAARLAGFLNGLFNSKHKSRGQAGGGAGARFSGEDSACSTASSFSRSCLAKPATTPNLAGKGGERTVRFQLPVDGYGRKTAPLPPARMTWRVYEEEEDDVASDSSSDLFELENLSAIGRYRDELPVYETTHLGGIIL